MPAASPLHDRLRENFAAAAPGVAVRTFFAPGRANLLGAHVDYNGGCVMPVALSRGTYVCAGLRRDGVLRLASQQFLGRQVEVPLHALRPGRTREWSAYAEGAVWAAQRAWGALPGLELHFAADLPIAKGLSSSASIECATLRAVASLLGVTPQDEEAIRLAHAAEAEYVGVRCGMLDQTAIWLGREGAVLHFDCRSRTGEHLPLDPRRAMVAIIDSGLARNLAGSEFNLRVEQCAQALALLRRDVPEARDLRDVPPARFAELAAGLPEPLRRRARHVIEEHARTERGAQALRDGDLAAFGARMVETHASLRMLYEVSTPELDALAAASASAPGCWGARLTGAGFGGCVVALVHPDAREDFSARVPRAYAAACGRDTEVTWFTPAGGPRELVA